MCKWKLREVPNLVWCSGCIYDLKSIVPWVVSLFFFLQQFSCEKVLELEMISISPCLGISSAAFGSTGRWSCNCWNISSDKEACYLGEVASLFHSRTVVITGKHPASGNLFSRNFCPLVLVLYIMGNILTSLTLYFVLCKRRWALDSILVRSRLVHERQDPPTSPTQEWLK